MAGIRRTEYGDIGARPFPSVDLEMGPVRLRAGSYGNTARHSGFACEQAPTTMQPRIRNSISALLKNDDGGAVAHWLAVEFAAFSARIFIKAIDAYTVIVFA